MEKKQEAVATKLMQNLNSQLQPNFKPNGGTTRDLNPSTMGKPKSAKSVPIPIPIKPKESTNKFKSNRKLICATWNIKRGLIKRELEIKLLLKNENVDVIFLTETDTLNLANEDDFQIEGYKTVFHLRENDKESLRIIALVKDSIWKFTKIRTDLM